MIGTDEPVTLDAGEQTTLRQIAEERRIRITVWHSTSYRPDILSPIREAWWVDVGPDRTYEITEATFRELRELGVPESI